MFCTECPAGFHGPGCLLHCSCHPDATCDSQTGLCVCPPGKRGNDCATCENYNYGDQWECDIIEAKAHRWTFPNPVLNFTACESGYWGQGCLSRCQCKEISVGCDPVTGRCACEAGFTGDHCEESKQTTFHTLCFSKHCHLGLIVTYNIFSALLQCCRVISWIFHFIMFNVFLGLGICWILWFIYIKLV